MERQAKSWSELKHQASKKTDVHNLIRGVMESDLKIPANPHKPMVNLGLGKTDQYLSLFIRRTDQRERIRVTRSH
jgi:hypothetical protein